MNELSPPTSLEQNSTGGSGQATHCPLCGGENVCHVAGGELYKGPCWCHQIIVPQAVLQQLAEDSAVPACLCRTCLEIVARLSRDHTEVKTIIEEARMTISTQLTKSVPEPDYYLDEFGNTVFTAAYHLKRGNCCGNQCRHCPY